MAEAINFNQHVIDRNSSDTIKVSPASAINSVVEIGVDGAYLTAGVLQNVTFNFNQNMERVGEISYEYSLPIGGFRFYTVTARRALFDVGSLPFAYILLGIVARKNKIETGLPRDIPSEGAALENYYNAALYWLACGWCYKVVNGTEQWSCTAGTKQLFGVNVDCGAEPPDEVKTAYKKLRDYLFNLKLVPGWMNWIFHVRTPQGEETKFKLKRVRITGQNIAVQAGMIVVYEDLTLEAEGYATLD